jgi:hypothetical protein
MAARPSRILPPGERRHPSSYEATELPSIAQVTSCPRVSRSKPRRSERSLRYMTALTCKEFLPAQWEDLRMASHRLRCALVIRNVSIAYDSRPQRDAASNAIREALYLHAPNLPALPRMPSRDG